MLRCIFAPKKGMGKTDTLKGQHLLYDFAFEGKRHRGRVVLDEGTPNVCCLYDDNNLEITWRKRIRHAGKVVELNVVVNDDANDAEMCGMVVASAWVCVYPVRGKRKVLESFEPQLWSYIDETDESNNTDQDSFYPR